MKTNNGNTDELFSKMGYVDSEGRSVDAQQFQQDRTRKYNEEKEQTEKLLKEYLNKQDTLSSNYILGFFAALVGALIVAIPWALVYAVGYFVGWLGLFMAAFAVKAYDLCKVKSNIMQFWCVLAAVVIGVFAGQILGDVLSVKFDSKLSMHSEELFNYYWSNPDIYLEKSIGNLALGWLFAVLGSLGILARIVKRNKLVKKYERTGKID